MIRTETRKVTTLGKYSYIVTLPKEWIKMHDINSGDYLSVKIKENGILTLSPKLDIIDKTTEKTLTVNINEDPDTIYRRVVACYLNGISVIQLKSKKIFSIEQNIAIRNVVKSLYMRIIESTSSHITIQVFMDESVASIESVIERMHIITYSMFKDLINSIKNWDMNLAKSIITLEEDVDQFTFFLMRILRMSTSHPTLASKLKLTMTDCFDYHILITLIEYIADHLSNIAYTLLKIEKTSVKIPKKILTPIITTAETVCQYYEKAVDSFLSENLENVNKIIDAKDLALKEENEESIKKIFSEEKKIFENIINIRDNISRIQEFTADIAEITIDRSILK